MQGSDQERVNPRAWPFDKEWKQTAAFVITGVLTAGVLLLFLYAQMIS